MINTYISVQREWNAGWGFNNTLTLTFTLNGSAFNISTYTFALGVRRIGGGANVLSLTQGSGITNGGISGILTIQITKAQTETIDADSYFYTLNYTKSSLPYSLLHGTFNLLDDYNPEDIQNSVTIEANLAGVNIDVNVISGGINSITAGASISIDNTDPSAPIISVGDGGDAGTLTGSERIPLISGESTSVRKVTNTRTISAASAATLTPNVDLYDLFVLSAQSTALLIANPTGTAVLGNGFMVDIDDNGSARAITYGNLYTSTFVTLPTTTIAGKRMKLVFQYNGTNWELLNVINEQ